MKRPIKLHILSDLHLEFGDFSVPETDRDILILAGDIHNGKQALEFLQTEVKKSPVIYVYCKEVST